MDNIETLREHAANWIVLMEGPTWDDIQEQQLNLWLRESSAHESVFLEVQSIMMQLEYLGRSDAGETLRQSVMDLETVAPLSRRVSEALQLPFIRLWQSFWYRSVSLAMVPVLVILLSWGLFESPEPWSREFSARGELRELPLADGSLVTLGAMSELSYRLKDDIREVVFIKGQAFFDVATDRSRPFIIHTGGAQIEVVGTKFDVRKNRAHVDVSVVEGEVSVGPDLSTASTKFEAKAVMLGRGDRVSMENGKVLSNHHNIAPEDMAQWREGRLRYTGAPLSEIIYDVNRYYSAKIDILDPELADLSVTASFSLDNIGSLSYALEKMLPIKVLEQEDGNLLLVSRAWRE